MSKEQGEPEATERLSLAERRLDTWDGVNAGVNTDQQITQIEAEIAELQPMADHAGRARDLIIRFEALALEVRRRGSLC
jgi:hypothetical protein